MADTPLINAARSIYGGKLAIDFTPEQASKDTSGNFIPTTVGETNYWLYIPAYVARIRPLLRTLLLSSDEAMQAAGTGTVFNLKGLGMGAFGFSDPKIKKELESLYIQIVQDVLTEIADDLQYITVVNIINLSSDRASKLREAIPIGEYGAVRLIRSVMLPTAKTIPGSSEEVGGTVFCGDSGTHRAMKPGLGLEELTIPIPLFLCLIPRSLPQTAYPATK